MQKQVKTRFLIYLKMIPTIQTNKIEKENLYLDTIQNLTKLMVFGWIFWLLLKLFIVRLQLFYSNINFLIRKIWNHSYATVSSKGHF